MGLSITEPTALWEQFRNAFRGFFQKAENARQLLQNWTSPRRTSFYAQVLLRFVEDELNKAELNLVLVPEFMRVDYVFRDRKTEVPLIFLESENNAFTAYQEVRKLCAVAAPLRVLLTVAEWDEKRGVWPSGGWRKLLLPKWRKIVQEQAGVWPNRGLVVLLIGEGRSDRLRFYCHRFEGENGQEHKEEEPFVEHCLPESDRVIEPARQEILARLARLSDLAPEMPFGQLMANLGFTADGPWDQTLWNMEDEQLIGTIRQMDSALSQRAVSDGQEVSHFRGAI